MNLTPNRRKLLIFCACIVLGMLVYPPLQFRGVGRGFGWIFSTGGGLAVDASQLLVQWIGVAIVGAIAYVVLGDGTGGTGRDGGKGIAPMLSKELGTGAVIPVLRLLRACVMAIGWWQVLGIVAGITTMALAIHTVGSAAIESSGAYLAQISLKAVLAALCIWGAELLRSLINTLHARWHGAPHASLQRRWSL